MQHVLPLQTGLYRCDEWMMQDINDKNLNGSKQNLTKVTLVRQQNLTEVNLAR